MVQNVNFPNASPAPAPMKRTWRGRLLSLLIKEAPEDRIGIFFENMLALVPDKWMPSLVKWADDEPLFVAALAHAWNGLASPSLPAAFLDQANWPKGAEDWFWEQVKNHLDTPSYTFLPTVSESNFWTEARINRLFNMVSPYLAGPKSMEYDLIADLLNHPALAPAARQRIIQSHQLALNTLLKSTKFLAGDPAVWQAVADHPDWSYPKTLLTLDKTALRDILSDIIPLAVTKQILARICYTVRAHPSITFSHLPAVHSFATDLLTKASSLPDLTLFQDAWRLYLYIQPNAAVNYWEDLPPAAKFQPATTDLAWLMKHPDKTIRVRAPGFINRLRAPLPSTIAPPVPSGALVIATRKPTPKSPDSAKRLL